MWPNSVISYYFSSIFHCLSFALLPWPLHSHLWLGSKGPGIFGRDFQALVSVSLMLGLAFVSCNLGTLAFSFQSCLCAISPSAATSHWLLDCAVFFGGSPGTKAESLMALISSYFKKVGLPHFPWNFSQDWRIASLHHLTLTSFYFSIRSQNLYFSPPKSWHLCALIALWGATLQAVPVSELQVRNRKNDLLFHDISCHFCTV
jgi:hypothetical protein